MKNNQLEHLPMSLNAGIFELKTAEDLFQKLEHDLTVLQANPTDSYVCFNFFVTAEHLPEWIHNASSKLADQVRRSHAILRVCSHIANGGKHFEAKDRRHTAVIGTTEATVFTAGAEFHSNGRAIGNKSRRQFVINLDLPEANELGAASIAVEALAARIVEFWRQELRHLP